MKGLTTRQQRILDFIQTHFTDKGYWPSIREIQRNFEFKSTNAVMGHLKALEHKGYLSRVPGQARAYNLKVASNISEFPVNLPQTIAIPIYGTIAAGYPDRVETSEAIGSLQIDVSTAGVQNRKNTFALKVTGESMINAGIHDGDLVIVEHEHSPANNDIVAALIDGETTLKRYVTEGSTPYLRAENPAYPDLLPATDLQIQGVARSVVRCLS